MARFQIEGAILVVSFSSVMQSALRLGANQSQNQSQQIRGQPNEPIVTQNRNIWPAGAKQKNTRVIAEIRSTICCFQDLAHSIVHKHFLVLISC